MWSDEHVKRVRSASGSEPGHSTQVSPFVSGRRRIRIDYRKAMDKRLAIVNCPGRGVVRGVPVLVSAQPYTSGCRDCRRARKTLSSAACSTRVHSLIRRLRMKRNRGRNRVLLGIGSGHLFVETCRVAGHLGTELFRISCPAQSQIEASPEQRLRGSHVASPASVTAAIGILARHSGQPRIAL